MIDIWGPPTEPNDPPVLSYECKRCENVFNDAEYDGIVFGSPCPECDPVQSDDMEDAELWPAVIPEYED